MCSDEEYMTRAVEASSRSPDPSTKVGALLINESGEIGRGCNCFPIGVDQTQERLNNRDEKYPRVVHAEMNAIASALHEDIHIEGGTIFTTHFPCSTCCGVLIQFGIKRIVTFQPDADYLSRWKKSVEISLSMLNEAEIEIDYIPR